MLVLEKDLIAAFFFELETLGEWNHSILLKYCKIDLIFIEKLLTKIRYPSIHPKNDNLVKDKVLVS